MIKQVIHLNYNKRQAQNNEIYLIKYEKVGIRQLTENP